MTTFHPEVREFIGESLHFANSSRTMKSGRYEWVTDLRPIGRDALLHCGLKRRDNEPHKGEHKLELLDTGKKGFSGLIGLVEATIEGAVDDLDVMRIDLCADILGTPIEWFLSRLRIKYKRIAYEIGELKYQRVGKAGIQTLSGGKRPNMVRVYNKIAEYLDQLKKLQRRRSKDADLLTLESEFGVSETDVITRIERQFGGGRIPIVIDSFSSLKGLPDFNPFTNIEILNGNGAKIPGILDCGLDRWLAGTRLQQLQSEMGEQQFRRWLSANSSGNAARYMKRFADFLQPDGENRLTTQTIFETYRESVTKQLAA